MSSVPCSSCGAGIEFAYKHPDEISPKTGKPIVTPVDYRSVRDPDGNLATWRDGLGVLRFRYLTKKAPDLKDGELRAKSHFAVCPHADQHRRT